ncbi:restriction endonuclease subunit S [Veillonella sp.]|uniref:restriction endonuclease subunit S n=1 Tax=Veillonella sp. TaxID=1926307 RepID=UPI0029017CE5|nr:restriction endonuclease subunit S [Veillonella sp.]MDU1672684.1 restriction endonuclease subunit S [Veillonella sp.]MDU1680333.1 restriction endonuclease subunit S [Veillonella sp.]MDU1742796.1 restriction endonuclease subunit S [Veillonella sp.]
MRAMKDSGVLWIGNIPVDWKLVSVKRLFSIGRGRVIAQTELDETGYPVYSSQTKDNGCLGYLDTYDYDYPQLTWTTDGANAGSIFLRTGYYNCTNVCGTLSPIDDLVDLRYQKYALEHIAYNERRIDTNGYKIMNNEMAIIKTLLPPLSIQHQIADYLDIKCAQIDTIIAKEQSVIEKLQEYKRAIITQAITRGLNPSAKMKKNRPEWIGMVPEHWDVKKIKYLTSKIGSGKTPKGGSDVYTDEGVLFIRSQNVYNGYFDLSSVAFISHEIDSTMSNTRVYRNDVLLNITGGSIGRSCLYESDEPANVNQHVCIIRCNNQMKPKFMQYFWNSRIGKISIDIYQSGANREGLNFTEIGNILIPTPELYEQNQIIDYLDGKCGVINNVIQQKHSLINKLTEYKQSLIYEVVTGKKEVPHV